MISIISPLYNCAPYIEACLESLRQQTMQDFEVILVDDHGWDDSVAIAHQWVENHGEGHRYRFLSTPSNSGPGIARNVGIEVARGEYVAFIDSDDVWEPTFLEALVKASTPSHPHTLSPSHPHTFDLAYCQLRYHGGKRDGEVHRNPVLEAGDFTPRKKRHFLLHFVTFSVCFLFRREFLNANHLRFPSERNSEDTNFLTRCLLAARTIACVDQPLYVYCVHQQSLTTGRNRRRWRQRLTAANKLMRAFRNMQRMPQLRDLHLSQYTFVMWLLYLKKGVAQALLEFFR